MKTTTLEGFKLGYTNPHPFIQFGLVSKDKKIAYQNIDCKDTLQYYLVGLINKTNTIYLEVARSADVDKPRLLITLPAKYTENI